MLLAGERQVSAAAIGLAWSDCGITGPGARDKSFACGLTTGADVLVASFVPPGGMGKFLGLYGALEVQTAQATLPPWWQFQGAGACRVGSLAPSFDFTSYSSCTDFWLGRAMGGMNYESAFEGANRGRIRVVCAVAANLAAPISASNEYYAFRLIINHAKCAGPGSCAGCAEPACITLTSLRLSQPANVGDHTLTASGGSALVTWQGGSCSNKTQTGTWGKLKSIYR